MCIVVWAGVLTAIIALIKQFTSLVYRRLVYCIDTWCIGAFPVQHFSSINVHDKWIREDKSPFIKAVRNLSRQFAHWRSSGADNCISRKNRSNYDTSNRFVIDTLQGSPYRKKTRATQNFNMAAIFQDSRHRLSWNTIFCLKRAANGRKRLFWLHILYSKHSECSTDVINTMQMFRFFQYGRQFPSWPPSPVI